MKFLVDEDFFVCLKFVLEAWGHDAEAVELAGLDGWPDPDVLDEATRQERVLVTFNAADFERLHEHCTAQARPHAGIIVCRKLEGYRNFHQIIAWMRNLLATTRPEDFPGKVHYLHTY